MTIHYNRTSLFVLLLVYIGLASANQWSKVPIGDTFVNWTASACIIALVPYIIKRQQCVYDKRDYMAAKLFLWWAVIGAVRGVFVADNYWEYKNLTNGFFTCMLPLFAYIFTPPIVQKFYHTWAKVCIPLFFIFFFWVITPGEVNFYLAPLFVLGCFMPLMPRKWRWIVAGLLAFMLVADLGARSQVLKAALAFAMSLACLWHRFIRTSWLRLAHWTFYVGTVVLLALGLSGKFNVFTDMSSHNGQYVERKMVDGQMKEEDLSSDTRTFIYVEVLSSAIYHDYLLWGRTLARGNDSASFGAQMGDDLKTGKYERYNNELLHLNILTWLGIVGVVLYSLIYLRSSWLAVYRSRSIYLKLIGVFIAFHWTYGWVEDFNRFDIQNIALWSVIAMGLSSRFRAMNDAEFKEWFKGIFVRRSRHRKMSMT